jgi:hypothetical protein
VLIEDNRRWNKEEEIDQRKGPDQGVGTVFVALNLRATGVRQEQLHSLRSILLHGLEFGLEGEEGEESVPGD